MKNVFIYCGINKGKEFSEIIKSNNFDFSFGFEAIPSLINDINRNIEGIKNVEIINKAVLDYNGKTCFYVYDRDASSSIGELNESWKRYWYKRRKKKFNLRKKIEVDCINLNDWIRDRGIENINYLVTDLQGVDFKILSTLRFLLENKKINKIRCEVEHDDSEQYDGLKNNKFSMFMEFFKDLPYKQIDGPKEIWNKKKGGTSADLIWSLK